MAADASKKTAQLASHEIQGPVAVVPAVLLAVLSLFCVLPRVSQHPELLTVFIGVTAAMAAWVAWLLRRAKRLKRPLKIEWRPRSQHGLQLLAHATVYTYWALNWPQVTQQLPLILAQVVFAYLFELCLTWHRYGRFWLGFGPIPIVFSTNLFMWFHDDFFIWQFGLIAVAYLGRELLRWQRNGINTHIFNPSAFALTVVSAILIAGGWSHVTWASDIAVTQGRGPFSYESIFAAGLIVQLAFPVVAGTMASVLTIVTFDYAYFHMTGQYFFHTTALPIAVFLGMTLLFTDPATSPQGRVAKGFFGVLYALGVCWLYQALIGLAHGEDAGRSLQFYDKLLVVPLLNLLVTPIETLGGKITALLRMKWIETKPMHYGLVALWIVFFALLHHRFDDHPGMAAMRDDAHYDLALTPCTRDIFRCHVKCMSDSDQPTCRQSCLQKMPEARQKEFATLVRCMANNAQKDIWGDCVKSIAGCPGQ